MYTEFQSKTVYIIGKRFKTLSALCRRKTIYRRQGVPVDFMGAPMFFPDLAHNVVYMKRFNTNTGAADVFEFHGQQQAKEQQAENPAPAFAPLDEFMDMKDTINNLKDEIERLKKPTSGGKAGKKNDASDE